MPRRRTHTAERALIVWLFAGALLLIAIGMQEACSKIIGSGL